MWDIRTFKSIRSALSPDPGIHRVMVSFVSDVGTAQSVWDKECPLARIEAKGLRKQLSIKPLRDPSVKVHGLWKNKPLALYQHLR